MGLFTFRRKKNKENEEDFQQITVEEALKKYPPKNESSREDILAIARNGCEQIEEVKHQLEEAKSEYEAVTAYLSDIQKIDLIPKEERREIEEAAEQLVQLEKEQKKCKKEDKKISDLQYQTMSMFEEDIERELPKLKEQEEYQLLVKEDMRQLEGERGALNYERSQAVGKKEFLRRLSIASMVMILAVCGLLIAMEQATEADMMIPFFMSGVMAIILIFYIIFEERRCIYNVKLTDKKLARAIMLINKTKVKYVNCTSSIDYAYEKYHVNSCSELSYQFREYLKAKEIIKKLEKSSEEMKIFQEQLTEELHRYGIQDADVWCYQANAILDKKEMVEVRHRLNVRRQKLRERIDYNTQQMDEAMNSLMNLRRRHPAFDDDIKRIMT